MIGETYHVFFLPPHGNNFILSEFETYIKIKCHPKIKYSNDILSSAVLNDTENQI